MKQSQSEELFFDLYTKMAKKIEESTDTIFSGVSILEAQQYNYEQFMESHYSKLFFADDSIYEKNITIKAFIENEVLSNLYTCAYDILLEESTDNELSFKNELILDNTAEQFNVMYKGLDNHEVEKFEESLAAWGATLGVAGIFGAVPAAAFGAMTVLGMNLLFPARWARTSDMFFEKGLGQLGKVLFGTKSLLAYGKNSSLTASNNNILNFDNIDGNPEVRKLFNSLRRSSNKNAPIDGINSIVVGCLESNEAIEAMDIDESHRGWLTGKYSPRNNSIFTVFFESLFKKAGSKADNQFGTLMRYRKCLTEKLIDMYKFLMIANVSQNKEYKKIIKVMKSGFHENPEQLLSFVHTDDETEQLNKENIMTLVRFRMFLDEMAKDLKRGAFDVDRESATFLTQKLKVVDTEIEDYLRKNNKTIETAFENESEFSKKRFKNDKPRERDLKRSLFFNSGSKSRDTRDTRDSRDSRDNRNNRNSRDRDYQSKDNRDRDYRNKDRRDSYDKTRT